MLFDQITIVGVGLIGGSVGLAAKARGVAGRVVGVDRDPDCIARAAKLGAIDTGTTDLAAGVAGAQLVVVCTPVDRIAEVIVTAARHVRPGTYFTDGGSTKSNIVATVQGRLPAGVEYVAAHPLAGSEKGGAENGRADLFVNRVTVLIVGALGADWGRTVTVGRFWEALGSRVVLMNAEEHDRTVASTSHLPHAVASGVAAITPMEWLKLTAGGFRDVTRIAAGDPDLWAAIFEANRDATLAALTQFTDRMTEFRTLLESRDRAGLVRWLTEGKQVRDALGT
ncbi:prephenate dehydrogenase [Gemmata obscuriglobus]|uniref:Prephenate dehydrogenase/arogenate dehydrogenase family protein n=1 Tax=Gemmata obscuriglobus TaxID=114 RepID=A0A2Z3H0P6_9BACT|nr:prephenate dehydrogenase [Gemmata obscuriglobus]AWM38421.1 prephenate dehydrogenase/arogenate dehydrogenase family protein [Gemmata obscuriglobus]QEG28655.1 prephenate dehydrogenase [Gemmata obscuriglobus]VTS06866.1 prephenate dehydrogenase : Prephenate dehydrogenase OS=Blastopirellula marina DSM 3645 GN=DSM3645_06204 PE=4 SV=1: PDH [Gemmata obscuriglobus UQM 2246]